MNIRLFGPEPNALARLSYTSKWHRRETIPRPAPYESAVQPLGYAEAGGGFEPPISRLWAWRGQPDSSIPQRTHEELNLDFWLRKPASCPLDDECFYFIGDPCQSRTGTTGSVDLHGIHSIKGSWRRTLPAGLEPAHNRVETGDPVHWATGAKDPGGS